MMITDSPVTLIAIAPDRFTFSVGTARVTVLRREGGVLFPHLHDESGQSLGPLLDAELLRKAGEVAVIFDAAVREVGRPIRRAVSDLERWRAA